MNIKELQKISKNDLLIASKSYYSKFGKNLKPHELIQIGYNLSTDEGWMEIPAKYLKHFKIDEGNYIPENKEIIELSKIIDILYNMIENKEIERIPKSSKKLFRSKKWWINKNKKPLKQINNEKLAEYILNKKINK